MNKEKKTFIDFLLLLTKWRKLLFINLIIVGIVSIFISLNLELKYSASAVVLPPSDQSGGAGLSSLINSLPIGALGLGNMGGGGEMTYVAILKSRSMAVDVINEYNLQDYYEKETLEETLKAFWSDYDVQLTEENMIAVSYEYNDSLKVAELINYIVRRLGIISTDLKLERAQITKEFIETRYFQNLRDIDSLNIALEHFHKKHGIIQFEEQTKALINATAEIESNIFMKKAEVTALKRSFGENHPQYTGAKNQLDILQEQLNDLIKNTNEPIDSPFSSLFLPFEDLPELGKEYAYLYSNYLLQTKLQEFLLPEYEQAKLQLMKDKPTLQVIDYAQAPDRKSGPKRAFIVIGAVGVAFIIMLFFILLAEYVEWTRENLPERHSQIVRLKNSWLKPFSKTHKNI